MAPKTPLVKSRKKEHVDIVLGGGAETRIDYWEDVQFVHHALPEVDLGRVDLRARFLGKDLRAPLMVASMTGGYPGAEKINRNLAAAAAHHGVALGLGSQRVALAHADVRHTFATVRDFDVPLVAANIGAPQLIAQPSGKPPITLKDAETLVSMVDADALIVHLNFLQEAVQPEGDRNAKGVVAALTDLAEGVGVPLILKETGAGVSRGVAETAKRLGAAAVDVGGVSGTTFAAVEHARAKRGGATSEVRVGETFREWGIPTPVSVVDAAGVLPLVATGGIRTGLTAAKGIALGADLAATASSALRAAVQGEREAKDLLGLFVHEIAVACFLTGSARPADLRRAPLVILGRTREWLSSTGHDPDRVARGPR